MARILIIECMQEVSSFNPVSSELKDFAIQRGEEMMVQAGLNTAVGGAIAEFGKCSDIHVVPLLSARAGSASGILIGMCRGYCDSVVRTRRSCGRLGRIRCAQP